MLQASVDAQEHIMATTKQPDLLTVGQAAKLLGKTFTVERLRAAIKRGHLEARRYGTVYLIERPALERYRDTWKMIQNKIGGVKKKYTITEAAKHLGISRAAVHLAIKRGKLGATWGRTTQVVEALLVDAKDLKAYRVDMARQRSGKKT
jgi:excisionase family DNA binding protein